MRGRPRRADIFVFISTALSQWRSPMSVNFTSAPFLMSKLRTKCTEAAASSGSCRSRNPVAANGIQTFARVFKAARTVANSWKPSAALTIASVVKAPGGWALRPPCGACPAQIRRRAVVSNQSGRALDRRDRENRQELVFGPQRALGRLFSRIGSKLPGYAG